MVEKIETMRVSESDRDRETLKRELLSAEGGCHEAVTLSELTGSDAQRIEALEKESRIFSVPDGGRFRFPAWQFDAQGKPYPGISQVLELWRPANPYALLAFFLDDHEALNGTRPADLLRAGDIEELLGLVRYELHHEH